MSDSSSIPEDVVARIATAKQNFPGRRIYPVDSPAGWILLGAPNETKYLAYLTMLNGDDASEKAKARKVLLLACAVDPDETAMIALLKDYVGLYGNAEVVAGLSLCAGTVKDETAKK